MSKNQGDEGKIPSSQAQNEQGKEPFCSGSFRGSRSQRSAAVR